MRIFSLFITILCISIILPEKAHALIIAPAVLLIPIAKIVALILSGFSIPVLGIFGAWSKINKKSIAQGIMMGIGVLLLLGAFLAIILKFVYPHIPFF